MNTKQCRYVITVAEKRSFSAAAETLMISQPSLSQYIQRIEEEYGAKFFDRSTSDLRITLEGKYYIKVAYRILEEEKKLQAYFDDIKSYKAGKIRIAISPYGSTIVIPKILKKFFEIYPNIDIELVDFASINDIEGGIKSQYDIAFTTIPSDKSKMEYELVSSEKYYLVVPKEMEINKILRDDNRLVYREGSEYPCVDLADFKDFPFIGWQQTSAIQDHFQVLCKEAGINPRIIVKCNSTSPMFNMANEGIGIAMLTHESLVRIIKRHVDNNVEIYGLIQDKYQYDRVIVYKKGTYITKPIRRLIDLIKDDIV